MSFEFPRPGLPAVEGGTAPLNRHWLQWLRDLAAKVSNLIASQSGYATTEHATTHAVDGSDAVTIAESQVTGLVADLAAKAAASSLSTHVGLTTAAHGGIVASTDSRLTDARDPKTHASTHKHGGADEVATATAAANAIPKADGTGKLTADWVPDLSATYATAAKGVTNGDSHDHAGGDGAQIDHGGLGGLGDDDHAQYPLLAGRAGGQTVYGDTAASGKLNLSSTSDATKGSIYVGDQAYFNEANGTWICYGTSNPGIYAALVATKTSYTRLVNASSSQAVLEKRTAAGAAEILIDVLPLNGSGNASWRFGRNTNTTGTKHWDFMAGNGTNTVYAQITTNTTSDGTYFPNIGGSIASGGNLTLKSTWHATKGKIYLGTTTSAYDEVNTRLGIGTASPTYALETTGQICSSIATGTAPLVVSSTTAVANLNADKLDGKDATDFPLLAGRSGGQTIYGSPTAAEDLTLRSNSAGASDGKIYLGTDTYATDYGGEFHTQYFYASMGMYGNVYGSAGNDLQLSAGSSATHVIAGPLKTNSSTSRVGIGLDSSTEPSYVLHVATDSAGKPGAGGLWTVISDERLKEEIEVADYSRCLANLKALDLKRWKWRDDVKGIGADVIADRHALGWVAQDVMEVFPKSVTAGPRHGLDDCLDLNGGQILATLYGAVKALVGQAEARDKELLDLRSQVASLMRAKKK